MQFTKVKEFLRKTHGFGVGKIIRQYWKWAKREYRKNGSLCFKDEKSYLKMEMENLKIRWLFVKMDNRFAGGTEKI